MKISNEQKETIKVEMENKHFKYRQSNGIDNYLNAAILEGIEIKGENINPFCIGDDGERVYGYDNTGNETRAAVSIIEQILMGDNIIMEPEIEELTEAPGTPAIPQEVKTGVIPQYLTNEIIAKHPGTIPCLISMQKTDPRQIKERKGMGGKNVKYVDTAYMTVALNYAALMDWSFEVIETRTDDIGGKLNISVLGCISMQTTDDNTITKQQWGSQVLKDKMEVGDALKAAASDAMKKCASMYGIATDVYSGKV